MSKIIDLSAMKKISLDKLKEGFESKGYQIKE